jgi:hypothetical protein
MQDVANPVILRFTVRGIFLSSSTLMQYLLFFHTVGTSDLHPFPAPHFKTFQIQSVFVVY